MRILPASLLGLALALTLGIAARCTFIKRATWANDGQTLLSLTAGRGMTRIAVAKHLAILEEAGKLGAEVLAPLNAVGDREGCVLENGVVLTPAGFRTGFDALRAGGWTG